MKLGNLQRVSLNQIEEEMEVMAPQSSHKAIGRNTLTPGTISTSSGQPRSEYCSFQCTELDNAHDKLKGLLEKRPSSGLKPSAIDHAEVRISFNERLNGNKTCSRLEDGITGTSCVTEFDPVDTGKSTFSPITEKALKDLMEVSKGSQSEIPLTCDTDSSSDTTDCDDLNSSSNLSYRTQSELLGATSIDAITKTTEKEDKIRAILTYAEYATRTNERRSAEKLGKTGNKKIDEHENRIYQLNKMMESMKELDELLEGGEGATLKLQSLNKQIQNESANSISTTKGRLFTCGSLFSTQNTDAMGGCVDTRSIGGCVTKPIHEHEFVRERIDALRLSDSMDEGVGSRNPKIGRLKLFDDQETHNKVLYESRENATQKNRRVSFHDIVVSDVFEIDRLNPCDKRRLFYTSTEMQNFRLDYIWELQAAREQIEEEQNHRSTLSELLSSIIWGMLDIVTCRAFVDLCAADPPDHEQY